MPNVLIVDDHVAVRAGLQSVLRLDPDIAVVAAVADGREARAELERHRVDVVLVDYVLDDCDGLVLAHELKRRPRPPGVVLYTAHEGQQLAIATAVAGADAMVGKGAPADDLLHTIRAVAEGRTQIPEFSQEAVREAARRIASDDLPILGMRIGNTPEEEIAQALNVGRDDLARRLDGIVATLGRLQHAVRE